MENNCGIDTYWDFIKDPTLLMKVFLVYRLKDCMTAEIYNQIRSHVYLIDDVFRNSSSVARYFLNILRGDEAGQTLRVMHELEVLDRYIPEFGAVKNLIRQGTYHQYTVDEHTIVAIENLDKSNLSTVSNSGYFMEILRGLEKPELLRLSLLLHDIGVGVEGRGGHDDKSFHLARIVLGRWGILDETDTEIVLFLIDNHLQMSQTAQRRNLEDRKIIGRFAELVRDEKHLQMLYLFTFADMRAVSQGIWNDWNAALLWELYVQTAQFLRGEYEPDGLQLTAIHDEVSKLIGEAVNAKIIQRHFDTMPQSQLLSSKPDEIAKHITLIEKLSESSLVLACFYKTEEYSQLVFCTRDELGLFCKITGVLASQSINILSAQVNTREDGVILDIFNVTDGISKKSISEKKCQQVKTLLKSVLLGKRDVETLIRNHQQSRFDKSLSEQTTPSKVTINNEDSDTCTVIEIQTQDRIGLLYTISQALYQLRLNLRLAKISTEGDRAMDVFYVQSENGHKVINQKRIYEIKTMLEESVKVPKVPEVPEVTVTKLPVAPK